MCTNNYICLQNHLVREWKLFSDNLNASRFYDEWYLGFAQFKGWWEDHERELHTENETDGLRTLDQ